ncbi:MAG: arylesterase, partial [Burkholderiales bacterium]
LLFLLPAGPASAAQTILVFGDSLSSGFGLAEGSGWVSLLEKRLARDKLDYRVVNASISGETTLGGRQRIATTLQDSNPAIVVIALGGNDGLRGNPVDDTRRNLIAIVAAARGAGTRVVLAGMRIPPNYGAVYARRFEAMYAEVARQQNVSLVRFLLAGFAEKREFFQADGIHPSEAAQAKILNNVYRQLRPLLRVPKT